MTCDNCGGRFRIAPEKVPASGVRARCAGCSSILLLRREGDRVVVAPSAPRQPLPPPQPVPEPEVELPDAGAAADPFPAMAAHEPPPPPQAPPAPPPLPPSAFPDEDSPWGAVAAPAAPPPPPPPAEPGDDPFASLSAPPLPPEVSFGNLGGVGAVEAREPSFVTGAVPLEEEERSARPAAAPGPAPAPRQRTASRLHLASAARKAPLEGPVSKAIWSVVVVGALVYGVLVGLHRDPTGLWDALIPGSETAALRSSDIVAGVYPVADGGRLAYLAGSIEGRVRGGEGMGIRVVGELLDAKGSVVSRSEGWAGALPTPEEFAGVLDQEGWERLSRGLARRGAVEGRPFVVAFPGAKAPAGGIGFRVTVREEPLPPSGTTVVGD